MGEGLMRRAWSVVRWSVACGALFELITEVADVHGWLWITLRVVNAVVFVVAGVIAVACWAQMQRAPRY